MEIYNLDAAEVFRMNKFEGNIDFQIHDIPYNVSVPNNIKFDPSIRKDMIQNFGDWDFVEIDLKELASNCNRVGKRDSSVLVWFNNYARISELVNELNIYYDKVFIVVWNKTNPKPQVRKRTFTSNYELGVVALRGKYTFNFPSHRESFLAYTSPEDIEELVLTEVYTSGCARGKDRLKDENGTIHPTQKPVHLIQHYIEILSNPGGDLIMDAYAGVGTTAIACIRSNRDYIINDIDSYFIDCAKRWINLEKENNSND